jgi:small subunit ribosomal protein S7
MPRRKRVFEKPDRRDPRYDSSLVGHLISKVMNDGKRSLAQRIVYAAIDRANEGIDTVDPLEVVTRAVENSKPRVEVKSRRVGGATYQVPIEVRPIRAQAVAMRWLKDAAANRNDKTAAAKLASEMLDAHNERGAAVKKREDTHKMAEANKAFAHFRW